MGLTETETQVRAVNEEFARLLALSEPALARLGLTREKINAVWGQKGQKASTGKTDLDVLQEFEQEYLNVVRGSHAAQMESIQARAEAFLKAGADAVRVAEWRAEMELKYSRDASAGMKRALRDYADEAMDLGKGVEGAVKNAFSGMEDALVNFVQTGKLEFSDLVNSIIADLARIAVRQSITGPLASGLESALGSLFGGGGGGSWSAAEDSFANMSFGLGVNHEGGVVGKSPGAVRFVPAWMTERIFADAPRYHKGGPILRPGEVPIIAQIGERVLSRRENAAYERGVSVQVHIHNNGNAQVRAEESQDANGQPRLDVFVEMADKALSQRVYKGTSQTANAVGQKYGLNGDRQLYSH
jgi:lambda family phage tail tape measure protein